MTLESDAATKCYRFSTAKQNLFAGMTLFFFAVAVANTCFFYFDGPVESKRVYAALTIGGFWFAMTLLGAYLVALGRRYRLWISNSEIREAGLFFEQVAMVSQIDELRWGIPPNGGCARLRGIFGAMRIDFGDFTPSDREELVMFLRKNVNKARQFDWSKFDDCYFPEPQVAIARKEADRRMFRRIANLLLFVGIGYLLALLILPNFSMVAGVVIHLLFGAIAWIASRRCVRPSVA